MPALLPLLQLWTVLAPKWRAMFRAPSTWSQGTQLGPRHLSEVPHAPLNSRRGSAPSPPHAKKQEETPAMPPDMELHPCTGTVTASCHAGEPCLWLLLCPSRGSTNRMCQLNFSQHLLTLPSQQKSGLSGEGLASSAPGSSQVWGCRLVLQPGLCLTSSGHCQRDVTAGRMTAPGSWWPELLPARSQLLAGAWSDRVDLSAKSGSQEQHPDPLGRWGGAGGAAQQQTLTSLHVPCV